MNEILEHLVRWYIASKRVLPWRNTSNPYFIWVSEIILQQTRVNQGLPYYIRFIETFPTVEQLAKANPQEILNIWKGLGYYRRALNMHQAATYILNECKGKFPNRYEDLLKLKGVGEYTAAAIASISYGEKTPVVDGNVVRVLSRLFLLSGDKSSSKFRKKLVDMIKPSMDYLNPSYVNQGLMELGAMICLPHKLNCKECPVKAWCNAFKSGKVEQFPAVVEKNKTKEIFFNYLIITDYKYVLMHKRTENNIWKDMYQFPLIEADKNFQSNELLEHEFFKNHFAKNVAFLSESGIYKHILSHRIVYAKYFMFTLEKWKNAGYEKIKINKLDSLPLPRLIEKMKNDLFK